MDKTVTTFSTTHPATGEQITHPEWCAHLATCRGDHLADVGSFDWPIVDATAAALTDAEAAQVAAAPTWDSSLGLDPAVVLHVTTAAGNDVAVDMTPDEALALVDSLVRAVRLLR